MSLMDNFPAIDVTHTPQRMQSAVAESTPTDTTETPMHGSEKNKCYTLEGAIEYFNEHPDSALHKQTAKWLEELHKYMDDIRKKKRAEADEILKATQEDEE